MSATVRRERRSKDWETGEGGGECSSSLAGPEEPTRGVFSVGCIFWLQLVRRRVTLTVDEKNVRRPTLPSLILSPTPGLSPVSAGPE